MGRRLFNGRRFSENGWPYVDADGCTWGTVPGSAPPVSLQVQSGPPYALIMAWAADWNAYVEPLRDADSASWTPGNSVATSNHPGGTACDLNWDSHKFGVSMSGFNAAQQATMKEMEDFYEGNMFWSQRWFPASYVDPMHSQVGYDTYDQDADSPTPKVLDFIRRKIRADGFSTFRRDGAVTPTAPTSASDAADVLVRATGISSSKASAVLPLVSFALTKCNCNTSRRIAAALAQWVVESGHFVYTEEIADGPVSQERWKYKGRTWIQLTWLENYRGFSQWCYSLGLVPDPNYFVDRPRELADQKWAALGPAYWWAVKYPQINDYADRGDIDNVSKWVNAPAWVDKPDKHANGEKERRDAYNRALALGDQLLTLTSSEAGDDMANVPQEQWDRVYRELTQLLQSRSPLRHLGEGPIDTMAGFVLNTDGSQHVEICKVLAGYGHPPTLALLQEVAGADPVKYPDRQDDAKMAQAILAGLTDTPKEVEVSDAPSAAARGSAAWNVVSTMQAVPSSATSTGQLIGTAYDALSALQQHTSELPPEAKAPLGDLMTILKGQAS